MGVVVSQVNGVDNRYEVHDAVIVQKQKEGRNRSYKDTAAGTNQTGRGDSNPHIAIILSELADYNTELGENFSLRETTEEDLTREYLESMAPTDSMTDSEKWLLGKYQSTLAEMREKQAAAEQQEECRQQT